MNTPTAQTGTSLITVLQTIGIGIIGTLLATFAFRTGFSTEQAQRSSGRR